MFCSKCGNEIASDAAVCPHCGNSAPVVEKVDTWLIPAILSTLLCCVPFGIVSIIYAAGANSAVSSGNYELAREKAAKAKTWFFVSLICGIVGGVLYLIINILGALA